MKSKKLLLVFTLVMLILFVAASVGLAFSSFIIGNNNVSSKTISTSSFDKINLNVRANLILKQSQSESIKIEAEDNLLERFNFEVNNSELEIDRKKEFLFSKIILNKKPINIYISLKNLKELNVNGSGKVEVDNLETGEIKINLNGSGVLSIDLLNTKKIIANINGSGSIKFAGKTEEQSIKISGSGNYESKYLKSQKANIEITGSGNAEVDVAKNLDAKVSGSGDVRYLGSPNISRNIVGSGNVEKLSE